MAAAVLTLAERNQVMRVQLFIRRDVNWLDVVDVQFLQGAAYLASRLLLQVRGTGSWPVR